MTTMTSAVLLLLTGLLAIAAAAVEGDCPTCAAPFSYNEPCSLYMAPSTIPNAGYGVYTAVDIQEGETIGEPDLIIPVLDQFKTLPYRGQQQFLSWLGYIWPAEPDFFYQATQASFPLIPQAMYKVDAGLNGATSLKFRDENKNRISAFAPGLASMVNSDKDWVNIKSVKKHHQISFVARKDIDAGSELFLYYGDLWNELLEAKQESEVEYDTIDDYNEHVLPELRLPTEQDKRNILAQQQRKKLEMDDDDEFDGTGGYHSVEQNIKEYIDDIVDKKESEEIEEKQDVEEPNDEEDDDYTPKQPLEWLQKNGICIDNLRSGPSKKRGAARISKQRGAFAKKFIPKGERIAPAPLLALKREDLIMYKADVTQKAYRNVLNFDKVVGQEQLLNYCYGDADSELLLLPYSPVVNFINHGGKTPNAEIRWPKDSSKEWLKLHPLDVLDMSGKIMAEFVALGDIQPDEEIVIDFGQAWDEAWKEHKETNDDMTNFRHEIGVPDGFFPETWKHQSVVYELAKKPLKPGELDQMTWKHNGKAICKHCYRIGLPTGFSQYFRDFAEERGITRLYEKLLYNPILESDEWTVFDTLDEQWFAQKYMSRAWSFNMH